MVRGFNTFKKYFEHYSSNYIIIGGTACDFLINEAGFVPRATKDIDMILVVEALNAQFVEQFWKFINDGAYKQREKSSDEKEYYRFKDPESAEFPYQIELFSRNPDLINLDDGTHLTPVPTPEDQYSLSAILLNDDYYYYILKNSILLDGIHIAKIEALICLKAKAYLDIKSRIESGATEDIRQLKKHKADIFRLTVLLPPSTFVTLPDTIQVHINEFANIISAELPDKAIFKFMGLNGIEPLSIFNNLKSIFGINS